MTAPASAPRHSHAQPVNQPRPTNEAARLANLRSYQILDSLEEQEYDDLTALAADICGTPVSLISLIDKDRQWFKSKVGLGGDLRETDRESAFCAHTISTGGQPLIVPDARLDPRFANNPLVHNDPNVVFYAGVPLVSAEGYDLGSICVIDHQPRKLTERQTTSLQRLGRQVVKLFELRRSALAERQRLEKRREAYNLLRDFSHVIAHDLKAPIRNVRQASEILLEDYPEHLPEEAVQLLDFIESRTAEASRMIDGVLRYSQETRVLQYEREAVDLRELIDHVVAQIGPPGKDCTVAYLGEVESLYTSRIAMVQTLQNLIGNAFKFNDKATCRVEVDCVKHADHYALSVRDNGPGIPERDREAIFKLFYTAEVGGQHRGHGVGLAIVRRLIEAIGGTIRVQAHSGQGTVFHFTIPFG